MRMPRLKAISFAPFKQELQGYRISTMRRDALAALAVALLTIPQSIAYSLLAGLPPAAGLLSAIFGTIFTASFGSSRILVSGPSTGVAILIQTSIADVLGTYYETVTGAARDALVLQLLTQIVIIVALIQITSAFFNVSKLLQFVSRSVMLGYFAGITIAITVNQLFYLLGIPSPTGDDPILYKAVLFFRNLLQGNWIALLIGGVSFSVLLFFRRNLKNWPDALFALIVASLLSDAVNLWDIGPKVMTLGDLQFKEHFLPEITFPMLDLKGINKIFPAAVAIALLAILEVFSLSRNFASRTGQRVQVNQDVFGVGIGNLVLSFLLTAMPCSGSATRTALNFRMMAQTRISAIFSGLFTAVIIYFCWPLLQHIPLAALAALLIATVPTLTNWQEVKLSFRATREDAWVFLITLLCCLIFSLDVAFFIGIALSIATFLKKSAEPHLVEYAFNSKGRLIVISAQADVHRKVRIIGIGGELYFASADFFQNAMISVIDDPNVQAVVLRLNNVYHMDASMCLAIIRLYETLKASNRYFLISGLTEEVWHVFHRAGLVKQIGLDNLYFTDESNPQFSTWKACLHAQELIHKQK
ncbi:MAG TPA: SulP family inorganic anion transporter [Chlamydiales bacterium]|jgi:SulP family sulfate permease|nr:SulP family inorganic anion transporter [Chlamydiales bacterium]